MSVSDSESENDRFDVMSAGSDSDSGDELERATQKTVLTQKESEIERLEASESSDEEVILKKDEASLSDDDDLDRAEKSATSDENILYTVKDDPKPQKVLLKNNKYDQVLAPISVPKDMKNQLKIHQDLNSKTSSTALGNILTRDYSASNLDSKIANFDFYA